MKKSIVIIIIILLVIVISFFIFTKESKNILTPKLKTLTNRNSENISNTSSTPNIDNNSSKIVAPVDQNVLLKSRLKSEAKFFIGQWGSYSSDSDYINLKSLLPKMSDNLKKIAQEKINQGLETKGFYSLMTKVIAINLDNFTETKISFRAKVQQQEIKDKKTSVFYKDVQLVFIEQGDSWKVDSLEFK